MVLIKPFFQGGSLARERERKRERLRLCIPAPNAVPCTSLRNLELSSNQATKTPDTPPLRPIR